MNKDITCHRCGGPMIKVEIPEEYKHRYCENLYYRCHNIMYCPTFWGFRDEEEVEGYMQEQHTITEKVLTSFNSAVRRSVPTITDEQLRELFKKVFKFKDYHVNRSIRYVSTTTKSELEAHINEILHN